MRHRISLTLIFTLVLTPVYPIGQAGAESIHSPTNVVDKFLSLNDRGNLLADSPLTNRHAEPTNSAALSLSCLSKTLVAWSVRNWTTDRALRQCETEIVSSLLEFGVSLTRDQMRGLIATTIAYRFAPYGESKAYSKADLLSERVLDCDNYGALTIHLLKGYPRALIGFNGVAVGNHAQVLFRPLDLAGESSNPSTMILDPTINVVALLDYDGLLSGQPAPLILTLDIASHRRSEDNVWVNTKFRERVVNALSSGLYRPKDALYFVYGAGGLKRLERLGRPVDWPTPSARLVHRRVL